MDDQQAAEAAMQTGESCPSHWDTSKGLVCECNERQMALQDANVSSDELRHVL